MWELKYNKTVYIWLILLAGRQDQYHKSKLRTAVKEAIKKTPFKISVMHYKLDYSKSKTKSKKFSSCTAGKRISFTPVNI